jgi:hypothetical protein
MRFVFAAVVRPRMTAGGREDDLSPRCVGTARTIHGRQLLRWLGERLCAKFQGHWNYYGVISNSPSLQAYWFSAKRLVFKWLNRRSQRRSYSWATFGEMWQTLGIPEPRIVEIPYRPQPHLPLS